MRKFSLKPVAGAVIQEHLSRMPYDMAISDEALKIIGEVPLIYGVISQTLSAEGHKDVTIRTKADFWRMWIQLACENCVPPKDPEQLLIDLGSIATMMLRKRDDYLDGSELSDFEEIVEQLARRGSGHCPVFVKEANDQWRFIHQAIREYALACSIDVGLKSHGQHGVFTAASLDYESAETYLYLQDRLPDRRLELGLFPPFEAMEDPIRWNHFARNYFEAVGMLGADGERRDRAIRQALDVIRTGPTRSVKYKTQYNAARCLSRLHSTSPPIYCEWVTKAEWSEMQSGLYPVVYGYAVRGFHQREHKLGVRPPEVFVKAPLKDDMSHDVCETLIDVIERIAEIPECHRDGVFLQVNCAHALIRWLDAGSVSLAERVTNLIGVKKLSREARMNLFLALCVQGEPPEGAEQVLTDTNIPKHFSGNLDALCGPKTEE